MKAASVAMATALFSFCTSAHAETAASWDWPDATSSPHPLPPRDISTDLSPLFARCGAPDAALDRVAERMVAQKMATGKGPSENEVESQLRASGEPHVWPRTFIVAGTDLSNAAVLPKLDAWRATWRTLGHVRCGIARASAGNASSAASPATAIAIVAVDALADLAPVPTTTHAGTFLSIEAQLGIAADGADVVVARDGGAPLHLLTSFDGSRVRARFAPDRPGVFSVQVLAHLPEGPRPVLEARVYADVTPPSSPSESAPAPGERAATASNPADALVQMIHALRDGEGLPPLTRDAALDRLAETHSKRMLARLTAAHDLGDGDPEARIRDAGLAVRAVGENVAHAASAGEAHRALYESPSHRANLLRKDFRNLGVAATVGPDGSVWVTELFAAP